MLPVPQDGKLPRVLILFSQGRVAGTMFVRPIPEEGRGERAMEEHREGSGVLTHRVLPETKFEVEFNIMYRLGVQAIPTAPHVLTKLSNIVNYVRSRDGRIIPDGEYELYSEVEGASEYKHLRKKNGIWQTLPYLP